jgi:hypothetical protein
MMNPGGGKTSTMPGMIMPGDSKSEDDRSMPGMDMPGRSMKTDTAKIQDFKNSSKK